MSKEKQNTEKGTDKALTLGGVSMTNCDSCGSSDFGKLGFCPRCDTDVYSY